jgi:hypothetical protein
VEEAERLPGYDDGVDSIGSGDSEETMDGVPGNAREARLRRRLAGSWSRLRQAESPRPMRAGEGGASFGCRC